MSLDCFDPKQGAAEPMAKAMPGLNADVADALAGRSAEAAAFLKALSHEGRLMILCHLAAGERSVTELEHLLQSRQAAVSQQLARLRLEGLVSARREGKGIFYSIQDQKVLHLVRVLQDLYGGAN